MVPSRRAEGRRSVAFLVFLLAGLGAWVWWHSQTPLDSPSGTAPRTIPSALPGTTSSQLSQPSDAAASERSVVPAQSPAIAGSPAVDRPGPTRLLGRVESAVGEPVAFATVALLRRDADGFWNLDLDYGRQTDEVATTRTDEHGSFAFDVARGVIYRLRATAAGFAVTHRAGCVGGQMVVIVVTRGVTVSGLARDKVDGAPIAGAAIRLRSGDTDIASVASGSDGTFQLADLPSGALGLRVIATGYVESIQRVVGQPDGTCHVEILLARGHGVRGTVRDAVSGAPVIEARVAVTWTMRGAVPTDAAGNYELCGLEHANFGEVHVRAAGYANAWRPATDNEGGVLDFALQRGGGVRGRVVDAAGAPMPKAYVAVGASFATQPGVFHTDWLRAQVGAGGRFVVVGLMPQHGYSLYARGEGCGARTYVLPRALPADEWLDIGDVTLLPGATLEGAVADTQGKPVPKIEVRLHGHNGDWQRLCSDPASGPEEEVHQFTRRDIETDGDGRFRFANLSDGTYELSVATPNLGREVKSGPVRVADGELIEDLRLVFDNGLSIRGHLRPPAGVPATGWAVSSNGPGNPSWSEVAPDGSFTLEHLDAGSYRIGLEQGPEGWTLLPVEATAGRTDVELVPVQAAAITGRVVGPDGHPVQAEVYQRGPDSGRFIRSVSTSADGRFRLWALPGTRVTVFAQAGSGVLETRGQVADVMAGSEVEVRLGSGVK
ncbi:MAG: carboxypeptidase-like regulatory domain-containing protein [Planctomycetota bacterium]